MPYNPAGLFSLVASYFASAGTTIRTEQHNPVFEDVASALSSVLLRDGRAPMTGPLNMNGQPINNVVVGSSPGSVATLAQSVPIGGVIDFAGTTAPVGWLLCNGQAVSRVTFAAAFAVLGTAYGAGDGSTTFNVPDFRGRVAAGLDPSGAAGRLTTAGGGVDGQTLGANGGNQGVTLAVSHMPSHDHGGVTGGMNANNPHDHPANASYPLGIQNIAGVNIANGGGVWQAGSGAPGMRNIEHGHSISAQGGGLPHFNVQPTIVINKIIRVSYDV